MFLLPLKVSTEDYVEELHAILREHCYGEQGIYYRIQVDHVHHQPEEKDRQTLVHPARVE